MSILTINNVFKTFGQDDKMQVRAIDGVSFIVEKGEFVSIMGASGSGKTTLLNLIATIDKPTKGSIIVEERDITAMNEKLLADYRRDKLGFIFQEYNLLDTLTVYENVSLPLSLKKVHAEQIKQKVSEILQAFDIEPLKDKFPHKLSGGERQRTAAARALITNPALIIADEPTGALDSKNSKNLMELLAKINIDFNATILTVTHDPSVAGFANRVLFLRDGKLFSEIKLKENESQDSFTARIISQTTLAAEGEQNDIS